MTKMERAICKEHKENNVVCGSFNCPCDCVKDSADKIYKLIKKNGFLCETEPRNYIPVVEMSTIDKLFGKGRNNGR